MPKVSIIMPTKNGEEYLEEVLDMVFKQKVDFEYEMLIVDSGSKDRTLEIINKFVFESRSKIKKFPEIKLSQISPQEFGHGKTRNLAVSKAQGEYFVFITQDATPADENWLTNMIKPMEDDPEIAGVFGKHFPRKDCDPFQRKSLEEFMDSFSKPATEYAAVRNDMTIFQIPQKENREEEFEKNKHVLSFSSNVNAAARRSVFEKIPFQDVKMGEDQFWAKDIILAGYKKAYAPKGAVYHSHNYGIRNQFKRWFDEFCQHKKNMNYVGVSSILKIPFLTLRLAYNDVKYIAKQKDYSFLQKIYWSLWIFFMDLARFSAEYLGGRYEKLPEWLQNRLSMQYELINKR